MVTPNWMAYKFFFCAVRMKIDNINHTFYRCRLLTTMCIREVIKEMSHRAGLPKPEKQGTKPIALEIWLLYC